jgi:hypothetical protein
MVQRRKTNNARASRVRSKEAAMVSAIKRRMAPARRRALGPSRLPRRRNPNNRGARGNRNSPGQPGTTVSTAPVATGVNMSSSYIVKSPGPVQAHADYGPEDGSQRVSFADLLTTQIKAGSSTVTAGFGAGATYDVLMTPSGLSARLQDYEELYQYYAFRELFIEYLPLIGTSTAVGVNIGVAANVDTTTDFGSVPTAQTVLEFRPSMAGPSWSSMALKYRHTGSKLWTTSSTATGDLAEYSQAAIYCVLDGTPVASTVYGKLRITGVVDFYKEQPPNTTGPSITLRRLLRQLAGPQRNTVMKRMEVFLEEQLKIQRELAADTKEFEQFLEFKRQQLDPVAQSDEQKGTYEDDYFPVESTTVLITPNNQQVVKLNPLACEFKQGETAHPISSPPSYILESAFPREQISLIPGLPKSESFLNSVAELVRSRRT